MIQGTYWKEKTLPARFATTIKGLDREAYQDLQSQLFAESLACKLHPVQYDDILWRSLSR